MTQPAGKSKLVLGLQTVFDGFIYVSVIAVVFLLYKKIGPFRRGFFCNDVTITYSKRPDTVTNKQLMFCAVLIPIALIILLELYTKVIQGRNCSGRVKQCVISSVKLTCMFLYGVAVTMLFFMSMKTMVGRLRPHFIETCKPDLQYYNCTNSDKYIADVRCADDAETDARSSFPSGHAALAAYSATFLVIYIEDRLIITFSVLLKSLVQVVLALIAIFVMISRVSDNRHHTSDVIAGGLLGLCVAVYTVVCLSHHFRHESSLAPSGGGEVVSMIDMGESYRRQKSAGAESTVTGKSSHSDVLLPI